MRHGRVLLAAIAIGAATTGGAYSVVAFRAGAADTTAVVGPGVVTVRVNIAYSHFQLQDLRVREGTLVRFVVHNSDPIDHEFVVGGPAVHARHEHGHELSHPPVPGEVSVPPGETGVTTYRFGHPGSIVYACHLPGHLAFGMVGTIDAVEMG